MYDTQMRNESFYTTKDPTRQLLALVRETIRIGEKA
jgi:hypothetical protein